MKNLIVILIGILGCQVVQAQEDAVFRQYFLNPMLVNPATVGADREHHNLTMNMRTAFTGFTDTPETYALSYAGPVGKQVGLGAMIYSENIADFTTFRGQFAYSMGIELSEDLTIRAGMSLEYQRVSLSNKVTNTVLYEAGDPIADENIDGERVFDTSLGLYAEYKNLYFGYAAPNLIRTVTDEIEGVDEGGNFKYYLFQVGGIFALNGGKVKLEPSAILRNVRNADLHVDATLLASFLNEQFLTGATVRAGNGNSIGFLLGTKYNTLKFVYSYDVLLDDFQRYNSGSHEITVGFEFGRKEGKFDRSRKYRDN